jgi:uncharacterized membrane protein
MDVEAFFLLLAFAILTVPFVLLGMILFRLSALRADLNMVLVRLRAIDIRMRPAATTDIPEEPAAAAVSDVPDTSDVSDQTNQSDRSAWPTPPSQAESIPQWPAPPTLSGLSELRIGQRGLLAAGIIVLVLGVGYFLQYSFQQGWVSPSVRVLLTYLTGLGLLGAGEAFRRRAFAAFGLALAGGGIATLYFATFAGHALYKLFGTAPAFVLMIAVTALAGVLAIHYNNRWLAVLGLIGGFLTPILIHVDAPAAGTLLAYLLILGGGVIGIAFFRRWSLLNYLAAAATWAVFSLWFANHYTQSYCWLALVFSSLYFLSYALAPTLYYLRRPEGGGAGEWTITLPNAVLGIGFGFHIIDDRYGLTAAGLLTLLYGVFFAAFAAWLARNRPQAVTAFTLNLVKAMVFTGLTVPVVFSGHWISFFWALLAAAIAWGAWRLRDVRLYAGALALGLLSIGQLYLFDYPGTFDWLGWTKGFHAGWTTGAPTRLFLGAVILAAIAALHAAAPRFRGRIPGLPAGIRTVAGLHLFLLLNIETRGCFLSHAPAAADAAISVLWALFSISLIGIGFRWRLRPARVLAIVLFAVTLLKVLLVDMAQAATPFRILSSIVLGLILIGASYLYHRFREHIAPKPVAPAANPAEP